MKILIVGADDVITNLSATPFLRKLAIDAFNEIDLIIRSIQAPLFITNPDIRRIFNMSNPFCNRRWSGLIYRIIFLKKLLALRQEKFDCIISLASITNNQKKVWEILSGVQSVAYIRNDDFDFFCRNKTEVGPYSQSDGAKIRNASLKLYPDIESVRLLARRYGISLTSYNIGIIINSASSVNWVSAEWACLIHKLAARGRIFLIAAEDNSASGNEDMTLMAEADSLCRDIVVTMVVATKTADFIAMISLCSWLISADSDAAWVAASLRVPVIYPESEAVTNTPPGCHRISSINVEKFFSVFVSDTDPCS